MSKIFIPVLMLSCAVLAFSQTNQPSTFQDLVKDAKSRVKEMNVDELKVLQTSGEKFVLIDVREDNEWDAGHAVGAMHVSKGVIERDIDSKVPKKDTKLVLYCGGGSRSALAADSLMKMGFSDVFSLAGGISAYKSAGLPVEKPEKSDKAGTSKAQP